MLEMKVRYKIIEKIAGKYRQLGKKEKGKMLKWFMGLTEYAKSYASHLLSNWGKKIYFRNNSGHLIIAKLGIKEKIKRIKEKKYDGKIYTMLKRIWIICDYICGKRLAPYLKVIIPFLEKKGEITFDDKEIKEKLLKISAATVDRMLKEDKRKMRIKNRSKTKPGTLLKNQIPVRTFSEWDEKRAGYCEMDLVAHDGGIGRGEYLQTLDITDVATCWTETEAVLNKAEYHVFHGIENIRDRIPFPILGLDSDNGSEFINHHLKRYCEEHKITFTRSRPCRKNDSCFVEEKNYSIVRRYVGYCRYEGEKALKVLNQMYQKLRLYTNYFQPVMKLVEKKRIGSKVTKKYDIAKTPYQRVMEAGYLIKEIKMKLQAEYEQLNPVELKMEITELQNKLEKMQSRVVIDKSDNLLFQEEITKEIGANNSFGKMSVDEKQLVVTEKADKNKDEVWGMGIKRSIQPDFTISHKEKLYQLEKKQPVRLLSGMKVRLEEKKDGTLKIKHQDKYLNYTEIRCHPHKPKYAKYPESLAAYYSNPVFARHSSGVRI